MTTALTTQQADANEIMESVIAKGDIGKLTTEERNNYYMQVCRSTGLNPLTRPLEYLTLQGKTVLYARKDAADQLRKLNGISLEVISREHTDDMIVVHVRATDKTGRTDEDFSALYCIYPDRVYKNGSWQAHPKAGKPFEGDDKANAVMKAVTKAKRRVTLSISGLGFLDETEVEGQQEVSPVSRRPPTPAPSQLLPPQQEVVDVETGDVTPVDATPWLDAGKKAASFGSENLKQWWQGLEKEQRIQIGGVQLAEWQKQAAEVDGVPAEEDVI